MFAWMHGWIDRCMPACMDAWVMDAWMDGWAESYLLAQSTHPLIKKSEIFPDLSSRYFPTAVAQ